MRRRALCCALALGSTACEFTIADWYYVDRTRVMGTRAEVVEIGPLWPERVGFDPLDPAITEPLPGDRLRLEAMVVDGEGRVIDPASIDALWFQCGADRCVRAGELIAGLDRECATLDGATMDDACMLGSGGGLEFEVPPVGPQTVAYRYGYYYMVAGVPGERSALDCWNARKAEQSSLDGCLFADRELKVGPSWLLLVDAYLAGLPEDVPIAEIPAGAFTQVSNRVPAPPTIEARSGGAPFLLDVEGPPLWVRPGQAIAIERPVFRFEADYQVFYMARQASTPGVYVFVPGNELIWAEWYTSGSLARTDDGTFAGRIDLLVDERAAPGSTSRLILLWGDDRGSLDMHVFEFEVAG